MGNFIEIAWSFFDEWNEHDDTKLSEEMNETGDKDRNADKYYCVSTETEWNKHSTEYDAKITRGKVK